MGVPLWIACLLAAIFSAVVSAENNIKFINHCPYDVYSWSVGPAGSGWQGKDYQAITIPANTVTYQDIANCETTNGGISVKLRDLPHYEVAPAGIVQVEYNLVPSQNHLWYDLSAIDCDHSVGPEHPSFCPLIGGGMKVYVENAGHGRCPPAWCDTDGQCHNAYKEHGSWQGEPSFRCDAGKDIVVEFCTARTGPRTFNGYNKPGHHEPQPDKKPGNLTTNGICGAKTPDGATCYGYAHGDCCSQYGWCGFTDGHCGTGCQSGFGNCTSDADTKPSLNQPPVYSSSYSSPSKPSTLQPIYSKSTPVYSEPTPSHYPPASEYSSSASISFYTPPTSYYPTITYSSPAPVFYPPPSSDHQPSTTHTPRYSHIDHPWPSYGNPSSTYAKPSSHKSTPAYSKPTSNYEKPSSSYKVPSSSYASPVKPSSSSIYYPEPNYSQSTPVYSKPSSSYATPSYIKSTPVYSKPTSSFDIPNYSAWIPTYSAPAHSKSSKSTYTSTYTPSHYTKLTSAYGKPSKNIYTSTYQAPSHSKSTPAYSKPSFSHIPPAYTVSKYTPTYSTPSYSTLSYSPSYTLPPYRTIYATQTITKTSPYIIKTVTVTVGIEYHSQASSYQATSYSTPDYEQSSYAHTPQQEPQIPSTWYNEPTTSSVYVTPTPSS